MASENQPSLQMASLKPKSERLRETIELLQKFPSLGIPLDSPEVQELKTHLDAYVKEGVCWNGTISFEAYGRMAIVNLPKQADTPIEVTLRVPARNKNRKKE